MPFPFQPYYANGYQLRQAKAALIVSTRLGRAGQGHHFLGVYYIIIIIIIIIIIQSLYHSFTCHTGKNYAYYQAAASSFT